MCAWISVANGHFRIHVVLSDWTKIIEFKTHAKAGLKALYVFIKTFTSKSCDTGL